MIIYTFFEYFLVFMLYSFIGWSIEVVLTFIDKKKFVDRGFLIGPYCPIYGCGASIMIFYLTQYKSNILTVFILGVVICSFLEYITSYLMELFFKTRWWDYSNHKFNLNGRICGQNCLLFGIGGLLVIYLIHPTLNNVLNLISKGLFAFVTTFILIIFIIDIIISLNVITKFKKTLTSIDLKKDSTQEFTKVVRETIINNQHLFQQRLMNAFPELGFDKLIKIKSELKKEINERLKKDN